MNQQQFSVLRIMRGLKRLISGALTSRFWVRCNRWFCTQTSGSLTKKRT